MSHINMPILIFLKKQYADLLQRKGFFILTLLGVVTGVATSCVIIGFVSAIDIIVDLLSQSQSNSFQGLPLLTRFSLPFVGVLALILLYHFTHERHHDVGIPHVIDRLQRARGHIPLGTTGFQFVAAFITLGSGFSLGKEGPAVHIGAGISSKLGRQLLLPPSQLRILTGCGTAAAISSAFDTPLAGILFAMEVVLMEYSLRGFIPVIAAAAAASSFTQLIIGTPFSFIQIAAIDVDTSPWFGLLFVGVLTGLIAALMHRSIRWMSSLSIRGRYRRLLLAAVITGGMGAIVPMSMGIGYDVMAQALNTEISLIALILVLLAKFVTTSTAVGLGVPAGIVAPSLVIGLLIGAIFGHIMPGDHHLLYALAGMAGFMGALLHAPLAALAAVLEMSLNAQLIFPALIVIVVSNFTCQVLFNQPSIFQSILANRGLSISTNPLRHALSSHFLSEIATTQFSVISDTLEQEAILAMTESPYQTVVIRNSEGSSFLLQKSELSSLIEAWLQFDQGSDNSLYRYLLKGIGEFREVSTLEYDCTLKEAIQLMQSEGISAIQIPLDAFRIGLVTREALINTLTNEEDSK